MGERLRFEREMRDLGLEAGVPSDKTYEERKGRRSLDDRIEEEFDIEIEKEAEVEELTNLVFFARHPKLKGEEIKGRRLKREWNKIRGKLAKPSSSGNSTGFVIDLTVPKDNPQPDFSKTENQLGAWEKAIFNSNLRFEFSTEKTDRPNKKPGSFVSMLSVKFVKPQFTIFIAKHLLENSKDKNKSGPERDMWRQIIGLVKTHAHVHLELFRRASENMEKVLKELFNRLLPLPTAKKPLAVSKEKLDEYLKSLDEFLSAIVVFEFWEKTCDWEKKDYPTLSNKINRVGVVFIPDGLKVNCDPKPDLPDIPLPPVPMKAE